MFHLRSRLEALRCVGTEPSPEVVFVMSGEFPELEFHDSSSESLPFPTGDFDLVLLRSVLHWIDRNYLLQTLGEAIRVASRYLVISDFAPHRSYAAIYHHAPAYRTYKMDYRRLVEASGFMRCVASFNSNEGDEWRVVRTSLFEKTPLDKAFPVREEADFRRD